MNNADIERVLSKHNAAIIAPAGHGKTEMIVDLVAHSSGKQLLLTHTNAGVDALQKRLKKKQVPSDKYAIYTIAGFCMKWCDAYPRTAELKDIPMSDKGFYPMYYQGAAKLFSYEWARVALKNTYLSIIVDEYQDCMLNQHAIFLKINEFMPVYVMGDPLQAIFGWAGELVSWNSLEFEIVPVDTYPWRWYETNQELGQFLSDIRKDLFPALSGSLVSIPTVDYGNSIKIVPPNGKTHPGFLKKLQEYDSVLYITKWSREQVIVCQSTGGLFQNDEPQSLNELYAIAEIVDNQDGYSMGKAICSLFNMCATHVNEELGTYWKHVQDGNIDFTRIKKHQDFGELLSNVVKAHRKEDVLRIMTWFRNNSLFRIYRKELFLEVMRAINYSIVHGCAVIEAAHIIRMMPGQQKRYSEFKNLSSRTVLSKGLEYDCVVIDLTQAHRKGSEFLATDYYVALSRAMKKVYLITDRDTVTLLPC